MSLSPEYGQSVSFKVCKICGVVVLLSITDELLGEKNSIDFNTEINLISIFILRIYLNVYHLFSIHPNVPGHTCYAAMYLCMYSGPHLLDPTYKYIACGSLHNKIATDVGCCSNIHLYKRRMDPVKRPAGVEPCKDSRKHGCEHRNRILYFLRD